MNLLALDTSSLACTVGLLKDEERFVRHEERAREHTRLLMPMIRDVLSEANVSLADCDAIVLGNGPGSFIGLRIAASVAQGLAFGAGVPVVPVSSMAAVAMAAGRAGDAVVVAQDARMNEVYVGVYDLDSAGLPRGIESERLAAVGRLESLPSNVELIAAGYGWTRYPELLAANEAAIGRVSRVYYPRATHLLDIGARAFREGHTVRPDEVVPAYLRQQVAQRPQEP